MHSPEQGHRRIEAASGRTRSNVTPAPKPGETFRWEWDTPMIISPNDPGALIVAANHVFVSHDRGDSWTVISPDLTTNANRDTIVTMGLKGSDIRISRDDGVSQWPAIVTLAESPKQPGLYYTGSDDGLRQRVARRRQELAEHHEEPARLLRPAAGSARWCRPRYDAGTVYVTVDNHRLNDYEPYMWVSTDFGATFQLARGELGRRSRARRSPKTSAIATCSTSARRRASSSRSIAARAGARLKANLPTVRVDEITLHPRDNAMLVATHGRALWMLDHLEPIQEYTAAQSAATRSSSRCRRRSSGRRRTTATTSSGATSTSSARTRRTRRSFSISSSRR